MHPEILILSEVSLTKKTKTSYDITYTWNLKNNNKELQNWNKVTCIENKSMATRGKRVGKDKMEACDWHIHTTTHEIDN